MYANELPKYTGDFPFVHNIYAKVPKPLAINVTGIVNTVSPAIPFTSKGTSIVAPNIAKICCIARINHFPKVGLSCVSYNNSSLLFMFSPNLI